MAQAGAIAAWALRLTGDAVRPGVSTAELDEVATRAIRSRGAEPTFLGYDGFPASICASVNEEIVHGIPSPDRVLQEGDIISIDLGATYRGWVGDNAWTYPVGDVDDEAAELLAVGERCLWEAVDAARDGAHLGDIGAAVVAAAGRFRRGIVRNYAGHGIGREMHESPLVYNYGRAGHGMSLQAGLTIAIEPMVCAGSHRNRVEPNGWTVVTKDGRRAVHFEKTIAVCDGAPLVLTREADFERPVTDAPTIDAARA